MQPDKTWTKKDFTISWFSGTGAGGQHRNKHQNCVRITHIESGITEIGQTHRERRRNFDDAFHRLANRLIDHYYVGDGKPRAPVEEVKRTYNQAENRVTDHQTGHKYAYTDFSLDDVIRKQD